MITLHDLEEAIMECQGRRNPDAKTCQMLAAFYIIKDHMFPESGQSETQEPVGVIRSGGGNISIGNSYSNNSEQEYQSETEFAGIANGLSRASLLQVFDELMSVLEMTNARLYKGVLRKLLDKQE